MVKPRPVVKIESAESEIFWSNGKQFVSKEKGNVEVIAAFEKVDDYNLVFDIEVINNTRDTFLICPEQFYYTKIGQKESDTLQKVMAYDPEVRLFNIEMSLSKQDADRINSKKTSFLEGALQVAVDVSPKTDEEREENRANKRDRKNSQLEKEEQVISSINSLNRSKRYWANEVLRKTTLIPRQAVYGKIYFNRTIPVNGYILHIPVGDQIYDFKYSQKVFYP